MAIGGGQGISIGTAAMRVLPVGVPKLMLSTIASGLFRFGPYVGTKDICMMHAGLQMAVLDIVLQHNSAGAIWMPDDLCYNSGPLVSPKVYRRLVYP